MLTGAFQITDPDAVNCTMTLTMPLADWKRLLEQLAEGTGSSRYPAWAVRASIASLVRAAAEKFHAEHKAE